MAKIKRCAAFCMLEVDAFYAMRRDVFLGPMLGIAALSRWTESWIAGRRKGGCLLHFYHGQKRWSGARQEARQRRRKSCGAGQAPSGHPKW
jgi:hypothetical protein